MNLKATIYLTAKKPKHYTHQQLPTSDPVFTTTMHPLTFIAISVYFVGKTTPIGAQTCHFPNGSVAPRDTPCRAPSSDEASPCCAYMDVCLDNGLCLSQTALRSFREAVSQIQVGKAVDVRNIVRMVGFNDSMRKARILCPLTPIFFSPPRIAQDYLIKAHASLS